AAQLGPRRATSRRRAERPRARAQAVRRAAALCEGIRRGADALQVERADARRQPAQSPRIPGGGRGGRVHCHSRGGAAGRVSDRQGRGRRGARDRRGRRLRRGSERGPRPADAERGLGGAGGGDAGDRRRGPGLAQESGLMDLAYYRYLARTIPPREIARALAVRARRALLRAKPFFFEVPDRPRRQVRALADPRPTVFPRSGRVQVEGGEILREAEAARRGELVLFGQRTNCGSPIEYHRDPFVPRVLYE